MKGKEKCKALKEIRRQIAEENSIEFAVSECKHQGDCKGTCPKCEAELKYLERELAVRQSLGKAVAIAGISLGACSALTACAPIDEAAQFLRSLGQEERTAGDIEMLPPEETCPVDTPETMLAEDIQYNPEWDDTYEGGIEYEDPEETN